MNPINHEAETASYGAIVVGCGVVGLAAAIVLANAGFRVAVVGPRPAPFVPDAFQKFDPRVFALSHRSQRLLDTLRVWDKLPGQKIQAVSEMQIWGDGNGSKQGYLRFNANDTGVEALTWIIEQNDLLETLLLAARYQPGIDLVDARLQSLSKRPTGWSVQGEGKTLHASVVIAADGAQSSTRHQAGLDFELSSYNVDGVVCTFQIQKPHHGIARQWFFENNVLAMLPLPGPYVSMVWSVPLSGSQTLVHLDADALAARVECACAGQVGQWYGAIQTCGRSHAFALRHGVAPVWFEKGVVLMGDAAHVVHPLAGQGLNLGLEDVAELAGLLSSRKRLLDAQRLGLDSEPLWQAWQRRRKAACMPVHAITDGLHTLFHLDIPGASWVRNRGMQIVNSVPMLKRWLSQQAMR